MGEDKKEIILRLMKQFPNEKLSVKQIYDLLKENMSYPTTLKWVLVLHAEGKLVIEDYGSLKLVMLDKQNEKR